MLGVLKLMSMVAVNPALTSWMLKTVVAVIVCHGIRMNNELRSKLLENNDERYKSINTTLSWGWYPRLSVNFYSWLCIHSASSQYNGVDQVAQALTLHEQADELAQRDVSPRSKSTYRPVHKCAHGSDLSSICGPTLSLAHPMRTLHHYEGCGLYKLRVHSNSYKNSVVNERSVPGKFCCLALCVAICCKFTTKW